MKAKEYLEEAKKMLLIINNKTEELARWQRVGNFEFVDSICESLQKDILAYTEKMLDVNRILESLPSDEYQALYLRYMRGLRIKEIASEMDVTERTVNVLIKNGLEQIEKETN